MSKSHDIVDVIMFSVRMIYGRSHKCQLFLCSCVFVSLTLSDRTTGEKGQRTTVYSCYNKSDTASSVIINR